MKLFYLPKSTNLLTHVQYCRIIQIKSIQIKSSQVDLKFMMRRIMVLKSWVLLWCWLLSLNFIHGARILGIFPIPCKSHFSCHSAMMRSLYNAGHQITFVSPFPNDESLKNFTVIDSRRDTPIYIGLTTLRFLKELSTFQLLSAANEKDSKFCRDVLSKPEIQTFMHAKEKRFDVMFIELIFLYQCFLPLAEKLNIPVIGITPGLPAKTADAVVDNPNNPALIPTHFTSNSDQMTFVERLENFYYSLHLEYQYHFASPRALIEIYEQFYTSDLLNKKQISLVFVNNHHCLLPRPTVPNVIEVGGIHVQPAKPLSQEFQKFINEAENGVILFSFGSLWKGNTMDPEVQDAFRNAFAQIPQRVIWKFEEQIEDLSDNVMLTKWMPQRDILAHKNVKAFISHCGLSGTYEALTEGVPMIFTPLLHDQLSNAALLEKLGVGILLDPYSATTEKVLVALNSIINDTRYRDAMKKLSEIFKDRPMSPQESIVYWTEYVIKHNGTAHARTAGADMPLIRYLMLDIIAAIIVTIVLGFYIAVKIIRKLYLFLGAKMRYFISV